MIFQYFIVSDSSNEGACALWLVRISFNLSINDKLESILVSDRHKCFIEVAQYTIIEFHVHRLRFPVVKFTHDHDINWLISFIIDFQNRNVIILISVRD